MSVIKKITFLPLLMPFLLVGEASASSSVVATVGLSETPPGFYDQLKPTKSPISHKSKMNYVTPSFLSDSYDLVTTPVKNQGQIGTCASFATGACVEHCNMFEQEDKHDGENKLYYSPVSEAEFTVYAERTYDDCKPGINLGLALKVAKERGFIGSKYWPYEDYLKLVEGGTNVCPSYPSGLKNQLKILPKYRLTDFHKVLHQDRTDVTSGLAAAFKSMRLSSSSSSSSSQTGSVGQPALIYDVKGHLRQNRPVAISVATLKNWGNYTTDGMIQMPSATVIKGISDVASWSPGMIDMGWHAVVLTGFDDSKNGGSFKFKNSWSPRWGQEGFGWLPYAYLNQYTSEVVAVYGSYNS